MQPIRKHIVRAITLVVALQLLNLSIYAQDFKPLVTSDYDVCVNINETIVEYVVEVVLGHTNAIPEQSQHHKDLPMHKHIAFKAISFERTVFPSQTQINICKRPVPLHEAFIDSYSQDIRPQPPKA